MKNLCSRVYVASRPANGKYLQLAISSLILRNNLLANSLNPMSVGYLIRVSAKVARVTGKARVRGTVKPPNKGTPNNSQLLCNSQTNLNEMTYP